MPPRVFGPLGPKNPAGAIIVTTITRRKVMRISFINLSNTKLSENDKNYTWQTGEFPMRPVRNSSTARQKKCFGAKKNF